MKADAQSAEKEALAFVVDHFSRVGDDMKKAAHAGWGPDSFDALVLCYIKSLRENPEYCEYVDDFVASAKEHELNYELARELTAKLIEAGAPLSGPLREFVAGFLRDPMKIKRRPGPSRFAFRYRDSEITAPSGTYGTIGVSLRHATPVTETNARPPHPLCERP